MRYTLLCPLFLASSTLGCGQRLYLASPQINKMTAPEICVVVVPAGESRADVIVKTALEACSEAAKHSL